MLQIPQGERVRLEQAAGGDALEIVLDNRVLDEYTNEFFLVLDGQETSLGKDIWLLHAYLFRKPEGRTFFVYDFDWASEDSETFVCEVTDGSLKEADSIGAAIGGGSVGVDRLGLSFGIQVLGSYSSDMEYGITDDGKLEPLEERYEIMYRGESWGLTLVKDLPVEVNGQSTVVPAGSKIRVVATDNDGTVWFETEGGSMTGTIRYERGDDDFPLYIDGISEYEYFETLPYAG